MKRITVTVSQARRDATAIQADAIWSKVQNATPAQIDTWLQANVLTIADARKVLRLLILAVRNLVS